VVLYTGSASPKRCLSLPFILLTVCLFCYVQKWKATKVRAYEKEEQSRRKRAAGHSSHPSPGNPSHSSSSSSRSRKHSSAGRPRLDTSDSAIGSPGHGVGNYSNVPTPVPTPTAALSGSSSTVASQLALRPPERSILKVTAPAVRFESTTPRVRSDSEVPEDAGTTPQDSPTMSHKGGSHNSERIHSGNPNSTSTNTAANSTQRIAFNSGTARVMDEHLTAQMFAFLADSKLLFTCGHWDHSCRITHAETGNLVQSVRQHRDVITCLALAKDFGQRWLVTGSRDCTLMVWDVNLERELPLNAQPQYILYGHDDSVSCVAVNPELDVVVSGSDDGTVIVHNLRDGTYVRSIVDMGRTYANFSKAMPGVGEAGASDESVFSDLVDERGRRISMRPSSCAITMAGNNATTSTVGSASASVRRVTWVGLSKEAYIITYSADEQLLSTYSMNGVLIASRTVPEALYAFMLSEDGKVLLTGGSSCLVVFRWVSCLPALFLALRHVV
jgi:WD40 repeat protein